MNTIQCGKWKAESGSLVEGYFPLRISPLPLRTAMTLIELMVVVVILVTLVAGVLPLVSPNNDARKITEAARGLQTYFMQAQAEAARTGRPVGVGFRETSPGSGVAVEAFQLAVPQPYAGLSNNARVQIVFPDGNYGNKGPNPKGGTLFLDLYDGAPLYQLQFVRGPVVLAGDGTPKLPPDPFPDGIIKIGDTINLEGNEFLIVDGNFNEQRQGQTGYQYDPARGAVVCAWINNFGQQPPKFVEELDNGTVLPGTPRLFRVFRQPATGDKFAPSPEAAFQFPAGVCLDMQGSGIEAGGEPETFGEDAEFNTNNPRHNQVYKNQDPYLKQIGLMFSPNGGIDGIWTNGGTITSAKKSGNKITGASKIFLLLGRVENQNPQYTDYDFSNADDSNRMSDEQLRERRLKVNWLNPDSRWMMINASDGRFSVSENSVFDPRILDYSYLDHNQDTFESTKISQIEATHGLAHGSGGQ